MDRTDTIKTIGVIIAVAGCVGFLIGCRKKTAAQKAGNVSPDTNTNMEQKLPRGYRNNNPLNIRINKHNNWDGKVYNNTDGEFEQFVAMEYGYRAALKLIRNYINNYGLKTVAQIISKWAPGNENNTNGYIERVCATTGWLPGKVIDPYNMHDMCDLAYAMALEENGYTPLPDYTQIYKGWSML